MLGNTMQTTSFLRMISKDGEYPSCTLGFKLEFFFRLPFLILQFSSSPSSVFLLHHVMKCASIFKLFRASMWYVGGQSSSGSAVDYSAAFAFLACWFIQYVACGQCVGVLRSQCVLFSARISHIVLKFSSSFMYPVIETKGQITSLYSCVRHPQTSVFTGKV